MVALSFRLAFPHPCVPARATYLELEATAAIVAASVALSALRAFRSCANLLPAAATLTVTSTLASSGPPRSAPRRPPAPHRYSDVGSGAWLRSSNSPSPLPLPFFFLRLRRRRCRSPIPALATPIYRPCRLPLPTHPNTHHHQLPGGRNARPTAPLRGPISAEGTHHQLPSSLFLVFFGNWFWC